MKFHIYLIVSKLKNINKSRQVPLFPRKPRKRLNSNNLGSFSDPKRDRIGTSLRLFDELLSDTFLEKDEVPERKKMFFAPVPGIHYREAKLTQGSVWFISFYCLDPLTGKLKRIRIKVNRIRNVRERRRNALNMVAAINQRLSAGWNPLAEVGASSNAASLFDCLDKFMKVKRKEMEASSVRCYESFIKVFKDYLLASGFDARTFVQTFNRSHAAAFMEMLDEQVGPKTYNNYLNFFRGLFAWMQEKGYCDGNPFDGIDKKPKRLIKKNRRILTDAELSRLFSYLDIHNREYLAMCLLCYGCFVRPKEIALLRCADLDLDRQLLHVSAEIAKNDNDSRRTVPDEIVPVLRCLDLSKPELFLFGGHDRWDFRPGKTAVSPKKIAKYWELVLRPELGFGLDLKFYSLKDTGITNMLSSGVPINLVQRQADHSSVAMTAIYVGNKADANGELKHASILKKTPDNRK